MSPGDEQSGLKKIAYECRYLADQKLGWLSMRGRVTREDLRDLFASLYDSPEPRLRHRTYVDLGDVTSVDVGFREIHWLSVRVTEVTQRQHWFVRVSIYAPSQVTFGLSRMYQQLFAQHDNAEVFVSDERAAALGWLDLPDAPGMPRRA